MNIFGVKRKQNVVLSDSTLPDLVLVQRSNTPFHSTRVDFRGATQAIKAKQRKEHNLPMVRITVKFMSISRLRAGISAIELDFPSSTRLRYVIYQIAEKYGLEDIMLADNGEIRRWARVTR